MYCFSFGWQRLNFTLSRPLFLFSHAPYFSFLIWCLNFCLAANLRDSFFSANVFTCGHGSVWKSIGGGGCDHGTFYMHFMCATLCVLNYLSPCIDCIFFATNYMTTKANRFLAHPHLAEYMKNAVKFQMLIEEYARLFATTWGRALLYLFEAFLLLTSGGWMDWLGFLYMVTLAVFAILLAMSTGKKLNSLKDVMKEMSRGTSMNDVEFIQKKFDDWDKDNSGHIDSAELRDLCIACGIPLSGAEAEVAYNILDTDRNGKIDKKEFVVWWKTQSRAWA